MVDITMTSADKFEADDSNTNGSIEKENMYEEVLKTSRYFTSVVELLPSKLYINQEDPDEDEDFTTVKPRKRKKKKPGRIDKKLLAKKAKLLKLDPSKHKSISELQEEVESKEKEFFNTLPSEEERIKPISVSHVVSNDSLEQLREKLHAKMGEMRGNRKTPVNDKNRKEKKTNKAEKKKKIVESANIKRSNEVENIAINDDSDKQEEEKVVFSKFDFATKDDGEVKKKKKDLKKLLDTAEKKQNKLKLLEEMDIDEANKMKEKIVWDSALQKAEGVKLKDNPTLLKKSIKRKEKIKEKSAKKWTERVEMVETKKQERQELRQKHIKERKDGQNKKSGKKKKKSKPGF